MVTIIRGIAASIMLSFVCKIYFETMIPRRKWRCGWFGSTMIPVFTLTFLFVAFSEILPYLIQPIRFTIVLFLVVQIYFQVKWNQNVVLSLFLCSIIWIADSLVLSVIYVLPFPYRFLAAWKDVLLYGILLALALWCRLRRRGKGNMLVGTGWLRFGYFPIFNLVVIVVLDLMMWTGNGDSVDIYLRLLAVAGLGLLQILGVYYIGRILEQERNVQDMRLLQEQTHSQMKLYQTVQKNHERQNRLLHDYKNQLGCIKGLLECGQAEETLAYVSRLVGTLQTISDHVDTHHNTVNAVLNQKYQAALEQKIAMTLMLGDLSALTLAEEDIVTLLANLLDNAMEACKKLDDNRVIHLKMILEEEQLILSIKNPVKEPVKIEGKTAKSTKRNSAEHGIGLRNVDAVIQKNHGTSSLRCENGWFSFSVMIPIPPVPSAPVKK